MADDTQDFRDNDLGTSPSRIDDPRIRHEVSRAMVWVGIVGAAVLAVAALQRAGHAHDLVGGGLRILRGGWR